MIDGVDLTAAVRLRHASAALAPVAPTEEFDHSGVPSPPSRTQFPPASGLRKVPSAGHETGEGGPFGSCADTRGRHCGGYQPLWAHLSPTRMHTSQLRRPRSKVRLPRHLQWNVTVPASQECPSTRGPVAWAPPSLSHHTIVERSITIMLGVAGMAFVRQRPRNLPTCTLKTRRGPHNPRPSRCCCTARASHPTSLTCLGYLWSVPATSRHPSWPKIIYGPARMAVVIRHPTRGCRRLCQLPSAPRREMGRGRRAGKLVVQVVSPSGDQIRAHGRAQRSACVGGWHGFWHNECPGIPNLGVLGDHLCAKNVCHTHTL